MITEKLCCGGSGRGCGKVLPIENFNLLSKTEYRNTCIECQRIAGEKMKAGKRCAKQLRNMGLNKPGNLAFIVEDSAKKKIKEYREKNKGEWAQLRKIVKSDFHYMCQQQGGLCAICKKPPPPTKSLVMDHQHGTNPIIIRGLLCNHCNSALGFARDDVEVLTSMIEYLNKTPKK